LIEQDFCSLTKSSAARVDYVIGQQVEPFGSIMLKQGFAPARLLSVCGEYQNGIMDC
jgi:hypothetical protein